MTEPIVDAPLVVGLLIWLAVAGAVGRAIGRRSGRPRIAGWSATFALFILPIWDLPFGLAMYSRYARELGGTRILKTVEAEGYLDLMNSGTASGFTFDILTTQLAIARRSPEVLAKLPYTYVEVKHEKGSQATDFIHEPGYWTIGLAKRGDPACKPFEAWATRDGAGPTYRERNPVLDDWCVVATRRDQPMSRYQFEYSGSGNFAAMPGPKWLPPVLTRWGRIVDRHTGELLAQSYAFRYESWLPMPTLDEYRPLSWATHGSGPAFLSVADVIVLPSAREW